MSNVNYARVDVDLPDSYIPRTIYCEEHEVGAIVAEIIADDTDIEGIDISFVHENDVPEEFRKP